VNGLICLQVCQLAFSLAIAALGLKRPHWEKKQRQVHVWKRQLPLHAACPTPDKLTCCGLPPPLSLTETAPLKAPVDGGLKVAVIVQEAPALTPVPQLFVWEKAVEPVIVMPLMLSAVIPVLVRVVVSDFLCPSNTLPKSRPLGLSSTTVPTPAKLTVCGLPGALSVIDSVPVRLPICDGLKVTLMVQLAPAAKLEPQVFVWLKSPLAAMLVIPSVAVP
jgi:hypothetical protein